MHGDGHLPKVRDELRSDQSASSARAERPAACSSARSSAPPILGAVFGARDRADDYRALLACSTETMMEPEFDPREAGKALDELLQPLDRIPGGTKFNKTFSA